VAGLHGDARVALMRRFLAAFAVGAIGTFVLDRFGFLGPECGRPERPW
jgi:hypothetical protein